MSKIVQLHRRIRKLENRFVKPNDPGFDVIAWVPDRGDGKSDFALFNTKTPRKEHQRKSVTVKAFLT